MAAIQKIRSNGKLLIIVIGIALLAFITEEFFRATEVQRNQNSGVIGTIDGKKFQSQDYSQMVEAYKSYIGFTQGKTSFTDDEDAALKEQVWQTYVTNKLIEAEAAELGLTVTDEEVRNLMAEGTNGLLVQTPFVNQQTGRFDAAALKNFLDEYHKIQNNTSQIPEQYKEQYTQLYEYWQFVERSLRESMLQQKYQALLQSSFTSNPIEAKTAYNAATNSADLLLVGVPYTTINDKDITVTDAELKAKYDELKESFKLYNDTKDLKYVAVNVKASAADRAALDKKMAEYAAEIDTTDDLGGLVRRSNSTVNYIDLPISASAFPSDIADELDSMSAGSVKAPYYNITDNTMNLIKLVAKTTLPDSIQIRQIQVGGTDITAIRNRADSIFKAIQGGANFKELATKYGQTGDSTWITSALYEGSIIDADNLAYIKKVQGMTVGQTANIEFTQGNAIVMVTDRRNMVEKYNAAVVKCPLNFSNETSKYEYNKFSKFIADNKTIEEMEKNAAKSGYVVQTLNGITTGDFFSMRFFGQQGMERHMMRWISNDAKKWIFDEAKDGEISNLYTCDNGSHLLVLALIKSRHAGYLSLDDVKDYLKSEVIREKKGEQLMSKLKGANLAKIKAYQGARIDTIKDVNFMSQSYDPAILGNLANPKANQYVGPVKGYNSVFAFQVLNVNKQADAKYDEQQYIMTSATNHARMALSPRQYYDESPFITYLKNKAEVKDYRYKFY